MSQQSTPPLSRAACEKVISLMADYLNGDLDTDLEARFERHLSQCQECLAYVNTYRQTIYLMRNLHTKDMATDIQTRVWELISQHQQLAAIRQQLDTTRHNLLNNGHNTVPRSDP